jgi:hypothetical protein
MASEFLYWDHNSDEMIPLKNLSNDELKEIFKSRYKKCAKEYRINTLLYTVASEVYTELVNRNEDMTELDNYANHVYNTESEEIDRQLDIMYAQVEPVA